jgi:hypothetical protein
MVESVSESYEKSLEKNKQLLAESVLQRESLSKLNVEIFRLNTLLEAAGKEKTAFEGQLKAAAGVQTAMQKNQEATFAALMQAQAEVCGPCTCKNSMRKTNWRCSSVDRKA